MLRMNFDVIKQEVKRLYEETPDNICGTAFGYKSVGGKSTETLGVVFYVSQKKPLAEIPENERLPAVINIDGQDYATDVVELPPGSIVAHDSCYDYRDESEEEIYKLQGWPQALVPMKGGQEIMMFPYGANRYGGFTVGTLGFFAIDNTDNRVVGVTNTHVAIHSVLCAKDIKRPLEKEVLDPQNTLEPAIWAFDGKKYSTGALLRDNVNLHPAAFHVKRYVPFHSVSQQDSDPNNTDLINKVDAALLIMSNEPFVPTGAPVVDANSFAVRRPADEELSTAPVHLPFATTSEINNLILQTNRFLYATGRTTGPKGYCTTKRLKLTAIHASPGAINYGTLAKPLPVKFEDLLTLEPDGAADAATIVGAGGDSGSAVLAYVIDEVTSASVLKIVGLYFAGLSSDDPATNNKIGWACRIDNVKDTLNIRAWEADYTFNTASLTVPKPLVVTETLADKGLDLTTTREEGGSTVTYWQAGCTIQQYYSEYEPTDINLSSTAIYESNIIGDIVGDFSTEDPDIARGVVDNYIYTLVNTSSFPDNASFSVFSNQLRANVVFNYSVKSSYSIRVRVTEFTGRYTEKTFTITVKNRADAAATNITLSTAGVYDTATVGTVVGQLSAVVADPAATFTYWLVNTPGYADNLCFTITGAALVFNCVAVPQDKAEYMIRVQARNMFNVTYEKTITISVLNV